jgi:hypothetical protein
LVGGQQGILKGLAIQGLKFLEQITLGSSISDRVNCIVGWLPKKVYALIWSWISKLVDLFISNPNQQPKRPLNCKRRGKCPAPADASKVSCRDGGSASGPDGCMGECFGTGTLLDTDIGPMPMEAVQDGCRVPTLNAADNAAKPPTSKQDADPLHLRRVQLSVYENGSEALSLVLLRSLEWIKTDRVEIGATLWLDLRHVGVRGEAQVTGIEPCPRIAEGPGRLVTGTFKHKSGIVYDLVVEGEAQPIRVTGRHPFWSVDRHDWVPAIRKHRSEWDT